MDYAAARRSMVENQIRTNRVTDPLVIAAMSELPRELFLPPTSRGIAYVDDDVPLGNGRFLMEPLVAARLLQLAEIGPSDVVLEVGANVGYLSAVIARLASAVLALESDAELAKRARAALAELAINTVTVVEGDPGLGYPRQAPYDVIVINGAVTRVPEAILDQLNEGGRLVAVVVGEDGVGRGTLHLRSGAVVSSRAAFEGATALLPALAAPTKPAFQF